MIATLITALVTALLNWLETYVNGKIQQHTTKVNQENANAEQKAALQAQLDKAQSKADQIAAAKAILKGI